MEDTMPEIQPAAEYKAVIVLSPRLTIGPAANRAAVLSTGLVAHAPEIIGQNPCTKDGISLLGFTKVPIPILTSRPDQSLLELADEGKKRNCITIVFLSRAQGMRSYDEYLRSISGTNYADLDVDAVALYGTKKAINSLTGNLPALRAYWESPE
jgi:hypothetical protein